MTAPARGRLIISAIFQKREKCKMNEVTKSKDVAVVEVLDKVLDKGAVVAGDIVISVGDIDLVYIGLKVMISSVETMERLRGAPIPGATEEPT